LITLQPGLIDQATISGAVGEWIYIPSGHYWHGGLHLPPGTRIFAHPGATIEFRPSGPFQIGLAMSGDVEVIGGRWTAPSPTAEASAIHMFHHGDQDTRARLRMSDVWSDGAGFALKAQGGLTDVTITGGHLEGWVSAVQHTHVPGVKADADHVLRGVTLAARNRAGQPTALPDGKPIQTEHCAYVNASFRARCENVVFEAAGIFAWQSADPDDGGRGSLDLIDCEVQSGCIDGIHTHPSFTRVTRGRFHSVNVCFSLREGHVEIDGAEIGSVGNGHYDWGTPQGAFVTNEGDSSLWIERSTIEMTSVVGHLFRTKPSGTWAFRDCDIRQKNTDHLGGALFYTMPGATGDISFEKCRLTQLSHRWALLNAGRILWLGGNELHRPPEWEAFVGPEAASDRR